MVNELKQWSLHVSTASCHAWSSTIEQTHKYIIIIITFLVHLLHNKNIGLLLLLMLLVW